MSCYTPASQFIKAVLFSLLFISAPTAGKSQAIPARANFIFIFVDDLNDYIEGYNGQPQIQTPNIKSLETAGTTFLNAFANAPGCAPSRTSFLSGKSPDYTQVYQNDEYLGGFRDNFNAARGNEFVYSLPQVLKDSGDYYTYALNKVFHNQKENDFDKTNHAPCNKTLSWNKMKYYQEQPWYDSLLNMFSYGGLFNWGMIPDSLEPYMEDYIMTDTAIQFIHDYSNGVAATCGDPFFLALGYHRPHLDDYIPQKYYLPYYTTDIYAEPFDKIYNDPPGQVPYNGLVMPPQPDTLYEDYYKLPAGGVATACADVSDTYDNISLLTSEYPYLPEIDPMLTDSQRADIIDMTTSANLVSGYVAAVQFVDAQIGRILDALNAHPVVKDKTYIILIGDHGYSLGEKRHWTKWSLWDTDLRVPFIIVDPSDTGNVVCNRTVSLLDLYPTILDLANVDPPTFPDGSRYEDGRSIVPLMNNVNKHIEYPVLSTVKSAFGNGSCYPHYSVRNERFHYIKYRRNNNGDLPISECDYTGEYYEEELYDIGENRQTDPYEWNNLISDSDYAPVKDYLEEFLPGGSMYNRSPLSISVSTKALACFINDHTGFKLTASVYDSAGASIPSGELGPYELKWTNSLTGAIGYGKTYSFNSSYIPTAIFNANDKITFYLKVTELATGAQVGFVMKTIYINGANIPMASFNLAEDDAALSAEVIDYSISGSYYNTYWEFGDGTTTEDFMPVKHYYAAPGTYTVKNWVQYGNGCSKMAKKTAHLSRDGVVIPEFTIFPNPANTQITVQVEEILNGATIKIYNTLGEIVGSFTNNSVTDTFMVDVANLPAGTYILQLTSGEMVMNEPFEVAR